MVSFVIDYYTGSYTVILMEKKPAQNCLISFKVSQTLLKASGKGVEWD